MECAFASFSSESLILNAGTPLGSKVDENPSPKPPGPAKMSITGITVYRSLEPRFRTAPLRSEASKRAFAVPSTSLKYWTFRADMGDLLTILVSDYRAPCEIGSTP